ncbi:hypothetical protein BD410DRAFT_846999 [Rickenella mellea]|uniref:Uncharacterized protein n=1 Tax=Rickenella mellea TaxID=50990 RepID=A0A4Y7PDK9_9AGAM|nr:hypothetical protein BD410DRAFT_846999 [Rickenella mellea]
MASSTGEGGGTPIQAQRDLREVKEIWHTHIRSRPNAGGDPRVRQHWVIKGKSLLRNISDLFKQLNNHRLYEKMLRRFAKWERHIAEIEAGNSIPDGTVDDLFLTEKRVEKLRPSHLQTLETATGSMRPTQSPGMFPKVIPANVSHTLPGLTLQSTGSIKNISQKPTERNGAIMGTRKSGKGGTRSHIDDASESDSASDRPVTVAPVRAGQKRPRQVKSASTIDSAEDEDEGAPETTKGTIPLDARIFPDGTIHHPHPTELDEDGDPVIVIYRPASRTCITCIETEHICALAYMGQACWWCYKTDTTCIFPTAKGGAKGKGNRQTMQPGMEHKDLDNINPKPGAPPVQKKMKTGAGAEGNYTSIKDFTEDDFGKSLTIRTANPGGPPANPREMVERIDVLEGIQGKAKRVLDEALENMERRALNVRVKQREYTQAVEDTRRAMKMMESQKKSFA